jgi:hypothetical protein
MFMVDRLGTAPKSGHADTNRLRVYFKAQRLRSSTLGRSV